MSKNKKNLSLEAEIESLNDMGSKVRVKLAETLQYMKHLVKVDDFWGDMNDEDFEYEDDTLTMFGY